MADLLRKKNLYPPSSALSGEGPGEVPVSWKVVVDLPFRGQRTLDFERFGKDGREDLARHFRDAVCQEQSKLSPETIVTLEHNLAIFLRFLEEAQGCRGVRRLGDIGGDLLRRYQVWLKNRYPKVTTQAGYYGGLMTVLTNRSVMSPEAVHPDLLEGRLAKNLFRSRLRHTDSRKPYSRSEQQRVAKAAGVELLLMEKGKWAGRDVDVVAVSLLSLAIRTGLNPSSLLGLRRECLAPHPLKSGREVLTSEKRRGHSTSRQVFKQPEEKGEEGSQSVSILESAGDIVRMLQRRCDEMSPRVDPEHRDLLVLYRLGKNRKSTVRRLRWLALIRRLQVFVDRHGLLDDHGNSLELQLSRFRPSCAESFQRINGGDIQQTASLLNQSHPDITSRHYLGVTLDDHLKFQLLQKIMVHEKTVGRDGEMSIFENKLPLRAEAARRLFSGGWNTSVARCSDPFHGGNAPKDGSVCRKALECFTCQAMVVFGDDLPRLLSFREILLDARYFMASVEWESKFGWVVRMIDEEILPGLDPTAVEEARMRAKQDPHPVWAGIKVEEDGDEV